MFRRIDATLMLRSQIRMIVCAADYYAYLFRHTQPRCARYDDIMLRYAAAITPLCLPRRRLMPLIYASEYHVAIGYFAFICRLLFAFAAVHYFAFTPPLLMLRRLSAP